jgi:hypothetical protein
MGVVAMIQISGQTYIDADASEEAIREHGEQLRAALTEQALSRGLLYAPVHLERSDAMLITPQGYAHVVAFEGYAHIGVRM